MTAFQTKTSYHGMVQILVVRNLDNTRWAHESTWTPINWLHLKKYKRDEGIDNDIHPDGYLFDAGKNTIYKKYFHREQHKQTNTNSNTLANPQIVLNHNFKKNNHVSAAIRAMAGHRLDPRAKTQSGLSRHKGNGGSVFWSSHQNSVRTEST